ncbi:nucleotidyltransferase [Capnocytophaga canimorsus]|uniref:Nucleotidyltransferase n=2 Tax=Capnocytophaga canimorsus TaxID=28188 RepID=A0A250G5S2_9FLAO|nr:NTP transferase domain-containing protein [Capnocytophaga canimorsus]ATA92742.1 nucleotidyltransferase [Capnocytophaga canimorsus]GIM59213.1 nucleotidyltransferase [Capnocytophaga canimorsus]
MKITLAVLAAGLGTRFGSDKQLEGVYNGNTLFDYSIYDALEAGFDDVVLIIRSEIDELVRKHFESRFKGLPVSFVYQDKMAPKGIERQKPWGTGHAMLCLKEKVKNPFLIINADDYYGKDAFEHMAKALKSGKGKTFFAAGYKLCNTLSENGTVARGICTVDANNHLKSIVEAVKLRKIDQNTVLDEETNVKYDINSFVSMNFWGFTEAVFEVSEKLFAQFVQENKNNPKSEFFIPLIVQHFIEKEGYVLEVLPNNDAWFGMTYRQDLEMVQNEITSLVKAGKYPETL